MLKVSRHSFLSAAAGAGAGALTFLYPGAGRANTRRLESAESKRQVVGLDPTYACGTVQAITEEGVVLEAGDVARAVRIAPSDKVWNEYEFDRSVIQMGDWLDVKGVPLGDGSLSATSGMVFVNIGRREGVIHEALPDHLTVRTARGDIHSIEFSNALEVIHVHDGSPVPGHAKALVPGKALGSVGVRLRDGRYRATRIWLSES